MMSGVYPASEEGGAEQPARMTVPDCFEVSELIL